MNVCKCLHPTSYEQGPGSSLNYNYCAACSFIKRDFFDHMESKKAELDKIDQEIRDLESKRKPLVEYLRNWR